MHADSTYQKKKVTIVADNIIYGLAYWNTTAAEIWPYNDAFDGKMPPFVHSVTAI